MTVEIRVGEDVRTALGTFRWPFCIREIVNDSVFEDPKHEKDTDPR